MKVVFESISGLIDYDKAKEYQLTLLEKRYQDEIPDTVLFLEHEPVVTRGRGLQYKPGQIERSKELPHLVTSKFKVCETERGGDLTYHGPGQLVIYPVFKLDGSHYFAPKNDLGLYLRRFEEWIISALASYEVKGVADEGATGVWINDKKIASIGIAVKKWITYHGAAINVVNDLSPFLMFSPCGFSGDVMTRLQNSAQINQSAWRFDLENRLQQALKAKL